MRRAAIVQLPACRSVKMTLTPLSFIFSRMSFSMSSAQRPGTATGMSCDPRPGITSTADTNPCAKSPCPATIARASLIILLQVAADFRRGAHRLHETLIEALRRIDPAVLEQVVHCDHFRDDRDVFAW